MDIFSVLQLIGGLCLFLFGMETMGDGLKKASGSKLESILSSLTSSVPRGVILGAVVTAVIQSSSATTVMLVGFVNSGIMQLRQVIPVIMGANIGTTATAWLLSLAGLEGDNIFIQLLKPMSFSPILALIAIIFMMFTKSEKKHNIGTILIGFAVLMYGMDIMSSAVKPLADVPEFTQILLMFNNPLLGVLAGALVTAAIQSSSASVGILQALCKTGAVTYGSAVPIIMGQNIGTCITAILSSIGANKGAKRVAAVHLSFNLLGTIIFLAAFYGINAVIGFEFIEDAVSPADIAVIHSIFNVGSTVLLVGFSKQLEKLAEKIIKDDPNDETIDTTLNLLDERFLKSPGVAAAQVKTVANRMAHHTQKCINFAMDLIENYDEDKVQKVYDLEDRVDLYEDALGEYIVKLTRLDLSVKDSQMMSMVLHNLSDMERITDHAKNIAEVAEELHKKGLEFSPSAKQEIGMFMNAVREIVEISITAFQNGDVEIAHNVEPLEDVIDAIHNEVKGRHVKRLRNGLCTIEMGFILTDLGTSLERVSDHCSNLAICLIETENDAYDMHNYLDRVKAFDGEAFNEKFNGYKEKYALPK